MYFLFDIGGTNVRFGISKDGIDVEEIKVLATNEKFESTLSDIKKIFDEYRSGTEIKYVSGGVASPLDKAREVLYNPPNLPNWKGINLKKELENALQLPVIVENDAALAALGESLHGAGKGYSIVCYYTISTGIGGARVVDGKLDRVVFNSEPGHQTIDLDTTIWREKLGGGELMIPGDFEKLASGTSIKLHYGKDASAITDAEIWEEEIKRISAGLANSMVHWSPEVIVLGGGVSENQNIDVERIKTYLKVFLPIYPEVPEVKKATLGDKSALLGALEYAKSSKEKFQ